MLPLDAGTWDWWRKELGGTLKIIQHSPLIFFMICGGKVVCAQAQCEQAAEQSSKAGVVTPGTSVFSSHWPAVERRGGGGTSGCKGWFLLRTASQFSHVTT